MLPSRLWVIGVGRSQQPPDSFWSLLSGFGERSGDLESRWIRLAYDAPDTYAALGDLVSGSRSVIYYRATPPSTFQPIIASLKSAGLAAKDGVQRRIVVRFSNAIFEEMLNRNLVESIQVTVADEGDIGSP
jgi:glucose-6-phosphate 1-dehydrogenase